MGGMHVLEVGWPPRLRSWSLCETWWRSPPRGAATVGALDGHLTAVLEVWPLCSIGGAGVVVRSPPCYAATLGGLRRCWVF